MNSAKLIVFLMSLAAINGCSLIHLSKCQKCVNDIASRHDATLTKHACELNSNIRLLSPKNFSRFPINSDVLLKWEFIGIGTPSFFEVSIEILVTGSSWDKLPAYEEGLRALWVEYGMDPDMARADSVDAGLLKGNFYTSDSSYVLRYASNSPIRWRVRPHFQNSSGNWSGYYYFDF